MFKKMFCNQCVRKCKLEVEIPLVEYELLNKCCFGYVKTSHGEKSGDFTEDMSLWDVDVYL